MASRPDPQLLWDALDRLFGAALRERASRATLLGLQTTDLDALRHVVARGETSPATVARVLQMTTGGTTAVIDRLEQAGLVTRTSRRHGRNRVVLSPTPAGEAAIRDRSIELVADVHGLLDRAAIEPAAIALLADAVERQSERVAAEAAGRSPGASRIGPRFVWG